MLVGSASITESIAKAGEAMVAAGIAPTASLLASEITINRKNIVSSHFH